MFINEIGGNAIIIPRNKHHNRCIIVQSPCLKTGDKAFEYLEVCVCVCVGGWGGGGVFEMRYVFRKHAKL